MYRDGKPENLCGDKYLQVELPCFDVPSLLDFSALDESAIDGSQHSRSDFGLMSDTYDRPGSHKLQ